VEKMIIAMKQEANIDDDTMQYPRAIMASAHTGKSCLCFPTFLCILAVAVISCSYLCHVINSTFNLPHLIIAMLFTNWT